jgi:Winged helix DNA-binding domain
MKTTLDRVLRWRVHRHLLGSERGPDPVAVAARVSGVHAQLAASATISTGLRCSGPVDLDNDLYERRTLVRTWAARGTLHLLPANDLPVWVAAMSTRNRETKNSWLKYHGVTAAQMTDIIAAVPEVLGAHPLTRDELADAIIVATGHDALRAPLTQGFGAILKPLAFRGLLCSGPLHGRNVTFVAPRRWLGEWTPVDTDEAIDRLVVDYLGVYGPAEAAEFARWFDLSPSLARKSFLRLGSRLTEVDVDGVTGAIPAELADDLARGSRESTVHLLPAFDPYVVGSLRQLDRVVTGGHAAQVSRPQGWIAATLVVNGRIEGVWEADPKTGAVTVTAFGSVPAAVRRALPEVSFG